VSQASEWVKILHIPPSTVNYASNIKDIETKQIALKTTCPSIMLKRTTSAILA
jgi:hypothetical protein